VIREADAIAHVVRCFENSEVTHVSDRIDPIADIDTIETELMLADLDSLERRLDALEKKAKGGDAEAKLNLDLVVRSLVLLRDGRPARFVEVKPEEDKPFRSLGLLTSKPVLYVCNVEEGAAADGNGFSRRVEARAKVEGAGVVVIAAQIEGRSRCFLRILRRHRPEGGRARPPDPRGLCAARPPHQVSLSSVVRCGVTFDVIFCAKCQIGGVRSQCQIDHVGPPSVLFVRLDGIAL